MTSITKKDIVAILLLIAIGFGLGVLVFPVNDGKTDIKAEHLSTELRYYQEAERINDYLSRFNNSTRIVVIRKVLKAIDTNIPKYFPNGPYTRKDFIAIAMVESRFIQYKTGRDGEFGIFQILPASSEWAGVEKNQFDLKVNTDMAFFVLQKKFEEHKDYKMGIIAYNGVVRYNGKVSEVYWDEFIKYRRALDDILRDPITLTE